MKWSFHRLVALKPHRLLMRIPLKFGFTYADLGNYLFMHKKYDLRERLLLFASDWIDVAESFPKTLAGVIIGKQLIRSGSSPGLHYGEAQGAESSNDFIHKMRVCLKELRETFNCLFLVQLRKWYKMEELSVLQKENNELISIFVASINTAEKNRGTDKKQKL